MNTHDTIISVRYAETDNMGIVHHSNYPIWFEVGRTEITKHMGMPYSEIEKVGGMFPLITLNCTYKSPAKYGDDVVVRTYIKELSYTRIVFGYDVYKNPAEKLLCSGTTEHVWTDSNLRPVNVRKHLPEVYDVFAKFANLNQG